MPNERSKRLMQEALDESLEAAARQELFHQLDQDPEGTAEFQRLRQVDRMLRAAPFERAPKALAMNIMARLAETLKQPQLSHLSGLALALALTLVTVVLVPLLISAAWMFLNAIGSAAALAALMHTLSRLLALVLAGVNTLAQSARDFLEAYPQTPALMVTILPVILFWLVRASTNKSSDTGESSWPDGRE